MIPAVAAVARLARSAAFLLGAATGLGALATDDLSLAAVAVVLMAPAVWASR